MKKAVFVLLSIMLALCFLPLGTVNAIVAPIPTTAAPSESVWDSPWITPLTGDKDFSFKPSNPAAPGIITTDAGLIVPSGFPAGQKQFGGEVAIVKDFQGGTAMLCFSFPIQRYGWNGSVYRWNNSNWKSIPSTLIEGTEGGPSSVCAIVEVDGTYALIMGYSGK